MTAAALSPARGPSARRALRGLPDALTLAACGAFMFLGGHTPPIVLWDESRVAVNALEMHLGGHLSLVTTYGFAPDLWNTKPPLLIWLMDLSMSLFGVSEWAMRLPSALAAMGTLALTFAFTRRVTGARWAGALAAGLLAVSIVFFGEHGARTADYEALLCLFTTGYLYVLFFALHRRRPGWRAPLVAGALIALAILTKSVAGLLPGLGVPVYLLLVGRWRRPLQAPWLLGAAPVALAPALAFYGLREVAAPGYLRAVAGNDLSGRFTRTLDRHAGAPWYYLDQLFALGGFSAGWGALAAPAALGFTRGRARLGLLYSLCVAVALLAALSLGATKLLHYAIAAAPFLAIAVAIGVHEGWRRLTTGRAAGRVGPAARRLTAGVAALLLLAMMARSVLFRATWLPAHEFEPQSLYGELIDATAGRPGARLAIIDDGVQGSQVQAEGLAPHYAPQLDFYRERAAARGEAVSRIDAGDLTREPPGALVGSCDPHWVASVRRVGSALPAPAGCVLVRRP